MKRTVLLLFAAAALFVSCSSPAKLINSSTYNKAVVMHPMVALFADLDVSPEKVTYFLLPSKTIINGGLENVINTAVREALLANGNADVMVALETQVKYDAEGQIESVVVTGYPAKYVNFRNPGDEYLKTLPTTTPAAPSAGGSPLGKIGFAK